MAIRSEVAGASLPGVGEEGSVSSPERDRTTMGLVAEEEPVRGEVSNLKKTESSDAASKNKTLYYINKNNCN